MRNKAKTSPLHRKWHRIVEGQINNAINAHPQWFCFEDDTQRGNCINSLAKRIVGEIVADCQVVDDLVGNDSRL